MILKAHVDEVLVEGGKATGVKLSDGKVIKADTVVCRGSQLVLGRFKPPKDSKVCKNM